MVTGVVAGPGDSDLAALSSLDDPVRARLYQLVSDRAAPVGRDEAAAAVGIGRSVATYHLEKLVKSGLLTASYRPSERGGPGAGRPAKVYTRSGREFTVTVPQRAYELAARLLAQAVASDRCADSFTALQEAARAYGATLGSREAGGHGRDARRAAEKILRANGFEPRRDEDGTIWLRNCPFHQLAVTRADVVCGMNLALVEGLTTGLEASELRPVFNPQPGRCCVTIAPGKATKAPAHARKRRRLGWSPPNPMNSHKHK